LTKFSTRALINTSPEPFTNWGASITEDLMVLGGLWAMFNHPWLFVAAMVLFIILVIWLLPKLWRLLKVIFSRLGQWLGLVEKPEPEFVPEADTKTIADQSGDRSVPTTGK